MSQRVLRYSGSLQALMRGLELLSASIEWNETQGSLSRALMNIPFRSSAMISEEAILKRAYEIWEKSGKPSGREDEFWHLAERELQEEKVRPPPEEVVI